MLTSARPAVALIAAMLSAATVTVAASGTSFAAGAEGAKSAASDDISGADNFQRYCALCHGRDGRGAGPVSDAMTRPAPDLTQIAKRNNGAFPFSKVASRILEGGGVTEHGASRMPDWGRIFAAESDPIVAKATIFEVTKYVESLQEK